MLPVTFRLFKATDEPESCERFILGHRKVLEIYGITMITSNKAAWVDHDNTYVILIESIDGKALGGARVQIADDTLQLPIEEAVGKLDPRIHEVVNEHKINKTGELCGLWNSREIAGFGAGSIYLTRACIATAHNLKLTTLFGLAAPSTVRVASRAGFSIERSLGNNGYFNYPKIDLIATAMIVKDLKNLSTAHEIDKESIFSLVHNPEKKQVETGPKGSLEIQYQLSLNRKLIHS
ncbi:MAG: hypothetical protein ACTHJ5_13525 [Ilyomonas sp.]